VTIIRQVQQHLSDISVVVGVAPDSALFKSSIYLSEAYTLEMI
jgi:hypothetical protein